MRGAPQDMEFTRDLLERQDFIYSGGRGAHPNDQKWPAPGLWPMRVPTGSLDSNAPPVHAVITDGIRSDYPGRFNFELADGVAMWKANFEYHYNHPRRPIIGINGFHDWALRRLSDPNDTGPARNEAKILKAFLLDVLVTNKDKYPDTYCVTLPPGRRVREHPRRPEADAGHRQRPGQPQPGQAERGVAWPLHTGIGHRP